MTDVEDAAAGRTAKGEAVPEMERFFERYFEERIKKMTWETEYSLGHTVGEIAQRYDACVSDIRAHLARVRTTQLTARHRSNRKKIIHLRRLARKTSSLIEEMRSLGVDAASLSPMSRIAHFCSYGRTTPLSQGIFLIKGGRDQTPEADHLEA